VRIIYYALAHSVIVWLQLSARLSWGNKPYGVSLTANMVEHFGES